MLRHRRAVLSCQSDKMGINISLLGIVPFLVLPGSLMYVLFSTCITLVVGTPVTIWICRWMGESMVGQVLSYQFPIGQMPLYIGVLVVLELLFSIWTIRKQEQSPLIEQMRIVK